MPIIYHVLDEREPFSERNGGAISRWAANVLRESTEVIVCPSFDASWGFALDRIYKMPGYDKVKPIHPLIYRLPWLLQKVYYLRIFTPLLNRVKAGDVIYVHNRPACAAALATVAARYKVKVVLHMHNSLLLRANRGQIRALREVPIVYCSNFLCKEGELTMPEHSVDTYVVYNGADEKRFRPRAQASDTSFTIIFTGRLVPYKGVHVLLEAMRILERQGVGNSTDTRYVRRLRRNSPSNTELVGYQSGEAFSELLHNSHVFCCPSIWNDPFPLAPLEGMAAGLPIVASTVGGLPEALAYGGGILVPPDDAAALAEALRSLAIDESHRKRLGREAREVVENHFLWSHIKTQYLAAVQSQ
jgi:spore coat protein SA